VASSPLCRRQPRKPSRRLRPAQSPEGPPSPLPASDRRQHRLDQQQDPIPSTQPGGWWSASNGTTLQSTAVGWIWPSPNSACFRPSASTAGFPTNRASSRKSLEHDIARSQTQSPSGIGIPLDPNPLYAGNAHRLEQRRARKFVEGECKPWQLMTSVRNGLAPATSTLGLPLGEF
jgi:hypothetical protein